jgi:hypothetical protein
VTCIPTGPYDKFYDFSLAATVSDEFGNTYPPIEIAPDGFFSITEIDVGVQSWKFYLAVAAAGAYATGFFLLVFPWPVFLAGVALITVAAGLEIAASDPPEPDPKYLEKVVVIAPVLPKGLAAEPTLAPFARVVGAIGLITAIHQALSVIEGRLLGARVDENKAGVQLQTDSYMEEIRNLVAAANELQRNVREVINIQGFDELFDPKTITAIRVRMRTGKVSPAMRREWLRAGLTRTAIEDVIRIMRDHWCNRQVAKGIALNLDLVARSLTRFATRMQEEAPTVLREVIPGTTRAPELTIVRPWVTKGKSKHASRKRKRR